jgi:predicted dehydrogenase
MAAKRNLGWGLIGASDVAKTRMIEAINSHPDSSVVAVMSSNPERAERYARENGIPSFYSSVESLLGDPGVDVVYVSTTNERHRSEVLLAARAGKHILCEKPLALTVADAREMVEFCKQRQVVLGTNHHLRNAITHRTMRSGVLAQFHDAFTVRHARTGFEVLGTEGSLIGEDVMTQEPQGRVYLQKEDKREELQPEPHEDLYRHQVCYFNAAVNGNGNPFTTGEDGDRSLAVAAAVLESTRTGQRVPVRY